MVLCILFSFTVALLSTIAPVYNSVTFMTSKLMLSRVLSNAALGICLLILQWENQICRPVAVHLVLFREIEEI